MDPRRERGKKETLHSRRQEKTGYEREKRMMEEGENTGIERERGKKR